MDDENPFDFTQPTDAAPTAADEEESEFITVPTRYKSDHTRSARVGARKFKIKGRKSLNGTEYVCVQLKKKKAWAPHEQFTGQGEEARKTLRLAGLPIIGGGAWAAILKEVALLKRFPERLLLERPVWTAGFFALVDGTTFPPAGKKPPVVLFRTDPCKCAEAGSAAEWFRGVAKPLAKQDLASFIMMTPFAAPLLAIVGRLENFGFEVIGRKGTGKTTLCQVASSAIGPGHRNTKGKYWLTLKATASGLERQLAAHSDMPMILEEAALFASNKSQKGRADAFHELIFGLACGDTKARFDTPDQEHHLLAWLMTGNEPIADVLGSDRAETASAACDRLITLQLDADRPFGVFDSLPTGFRSSGELAKALTNCLEKHHGHAFRRYLKKLVEARGEDGDELRDWIENRLSWFRNVVGIDPNDGSAGRVADIFGLVYAAGMLAVKYHCLPQSYRPLRAAKACYRLHIAGSEQRPFRDRIIALSHHPEAINLDETELTTLTDKELARIPAFVRTNRSGETEVLLVKRALLRAFPDWRRLRGDPSVQVMRRMDNDDHNPKRQLRSNMPKDRPYCFILGDD